MQSCCDRDVLTIYPRDWKNHWKVYSDRPGIHPGLRYASSGLRSLNMGNTNLNTPGIEWLCLKIIQSPWKKEYFHDVPFDHLYDVIRQAVLLSLVSVARMEGNGIRDIVKQWPIAEVIVL